MTRLEQIARELAAIDSLPVLWRAMLTYFREEGFAALGYLILPRSNPPRPLAVFTHGYPVELERTYRDELMGDDDPITAYVMARGDPMRWSHVMDAMKLDPAQLAVQARLDALGRGDGISIPLFGPQGRRAFVALGMPENEAVLDNADLLRLQAMAQAAHVRMVALTPAGVADGHCLSKREMEILRWVAQGKSNSVISQILGISSATVDTYLRRLFQKLDVGDRTSAAVKGVGLGLIQI